MKVLVQGQELGWVKQLQQIGKEKQIDIIFMAEGRLQEADLLVTDFPMHQDMPAEVPFLAVSEKGDEKTILEAFRQGAEDYLIFPVSPRIAAARIESILKRYGYRKSHIPFTPNEHRLICYMMRHPGHVLTREQLLEKVFIHGYQGIERNVDNYVKEIRKKMKAAGDADKIQTVYGVGYRYVPHSNTV